MRRCQLLTQDRHINMVQFLSWYEHAAALPRPTTHDVDVYDNMRAY